VYVAFFCTEFAPRDLRFGDVGRIDGSQRWWRHLNSIYHKLGVRSRAAATRYALERGLVLLTF
jgi:hypothetical protein